MKLKEILYITPIGLFGRNGALTLSRLLVSAKHHVRHENDAVQDNTDFRQDKVDSHLHKPNNWLQKQSSPCFAT
jgi:hypothetical protein